MALISLVLLIAIVFFLIKGAWWVSLILGIAEIVIEGSSPALFGRKAMAQRANTSHAPSFYAPSKLPAMKERPTAIDSWPWWQRTLVGAAIGGAVAAVAIVSGGDHWWILAIPAGAAFINVRIQTRGRVLW